MIRDPGPTYNLGFGVPAMHGQAEEGVPSDASFIQKALQDKPVASFLATSAASIVAMHVAGRVVRSGGLRLGYRMQEAAKAGNTFAQTSVNSIRQIRTYLDTLEGVSRDLIDPNDLSQLVKREKNISGGKTKYRFSGEKTHQVDNFFVRAGRIKDGDPVEEWTFRNSIQQRLVSQARRLPYELPALYAADKAVIQPLFNRDPERKKVNWANPIDVLGDFASTSVRNLATAIVPFELGMGYGGAQYNRFMSQAGQFFAGPANQQVQGLGILSMRTLLGQVGAGVGDILNKTARFSNQTAGAMSGFVNNSLENSTSFSQWVNQISSQAIANKPGIANAGFSRRMFAFARQAMTKDNAELHLNTLPGPFKGIGSALRSSRQAFKETGQTYDQWQQIVSGQKKLGGFNLDDQARITEFMKRGGQTRVEEYATEIWQRGRGGRYLPGTKKANSGWREGTFYQERSSAAYRSLLTAELEAVGLNKEVASRFTRNAELLKPVNPYSKNAAPGGSLSERIRMVTGSYTGGESPTEWWNWLAGTTKKANIDLEPLGFKKFKSAVTKADAIYGTRTFRRQLEDEVETQWNFIHGKVLPKFGGDILTTSRRPFEEFDGALKSSQRDFLVRRTAQRLGISTTDRTGNLIPDKILQDEIRTKGLEPTKMHTLRGYLVGKGDISKPWSVGGANLFGFRPVSVGDALRDDYFAGTTPEVRNEIAHIVNSKQIGYQLPNTANALRLRGVYRMGNGQVLDVGRITRGVSRAMDRLSDETQIPLLHIRPLNLLGHGATKGLRQKSVIQSASGDSLQPFIHTPDGTPKPDFYLWMKTSARGSKGKVVSITGGKGGTNPQAFEFAGSYRAFDTDPYSLIGRHTRLANQDTGMPSSDQQEKKWKRRADISFDQSESLFGLAARWREFRSKTPGARRSPIRAAEWYSKDFDPAKFTPEDTEGFYNLQRTLRNYGFSRRVISQLSERKAFSNYFELNTPYGRRKLNDISDAHLPEVIRQTLDDDIVAATTKDEASLLRRLQQNLTNILAEGSRKTDFFNASTPQAMRSVGVSRRIDELRNEFYKYSAIKSEMKGGSQGFNSWIQKLLTEVEDLHMSGLIAKGEKAEARAAVLGIQLEYFTNQAYREIVDSQTSAVLGAVPQSIARRTIDLMLDPVTGNANNRKLLEEFATRDPSSMGRLGALKKLTRKRFGATPYDEGEIWNPFGATTAFVPTFGTAFKQDPRGATASVLGVNTWSSPQNFSGSSIVSSHMVFRLNRYFETFSMGIDPSKYRGPLDFYARGMVGKRVLPIVAGATTFTMADRQLGGLVHEDEQGEPIYSPLVMGMGAEALKELQVGLAAGIPGGQTGEERRYELEEGEVPIRAGRYWSLGNTPFKGGRIQYFRPSWYQRFKSGATFIPEKRETPAERLLFGYDFSPLRPLDPYRFERQNYETRPYPVSGDYFTGPWGPLTSALNATVGRVMKPRIEMHDREVEYGLQQYARVGESGAYMSTSPIIGRPGSYSSNEVQAALGSTNASYAAAAYMPRAGTSFYGNMNVSPGRGGASTIGRQNATLLAGQYSQAAQYPGSYVSVWNALSPYGVPGGNVPYGVPVNQGQMPQRVVAAQEPLNPGSFDFQSRRFGYQTQEILGIYGFMGANLRSSLGFGNGDMTPNQAILEPASRGYSSARSFWGMNLGGLGDLPMPIEGNYANLEISEIVRRFVPKEQSGINYVNPIPNELGKQYPWLPGMNYPLNPLKMGDPYGQMPDAEIRLPGSGYERTHQLYPDQYGRLGMANIHDILGDVAPWSQEYRAIDALAGRTSDPLQQAKIAQTRAQVDAMRMKQEFTPYEYRYRDPLEVAEHPVKFGVGRLGEWLAHRDTFFNTKFLPVRTAVEDWERDEVYGATFPTWQNPIESFIKPMANKAGQRNPFLAALSLGAVGTLFGVTPKAKAFGSLIGGTLGFGVSAYRHTEEALTGERFIPKERRRQLGLEEYVDILSYTRAATLASRAAASGDAATAAYWVKESKKTMYGVDLNSTPEQIAMAIPKRKREHFRAMIYAPAQEREQILSTAGRLERRIYQAAWGMPVEEKPDLPEYFEEHELPPPEAEIWSPLLNMDTIKIKVGQSIGIDMAQMGYFPQQIKEANLINPSYPDMFKESSNESVHAQLRRLLYTQNLQGSVRQVMTPYSGTRVELNAGVF